MPRVGPDPARPQLPSGLPRRGFVAATATVASLGGLVDPLVRTAHAAGSDRLRFGIVGCGGRGLGAAAQAVAADPGNVLWAMADAFPDKLEQGFNVLSRAVAARVEQDPAYAERLDCTPERRFAGLDAYQAVIESCDVVLLATPTVFRPIHLRAAIEAGRHVFCEKPMAIDATSLRHVRDSTVLAREKGLSLVSGFCWRYATQMRDIFGRIADGAIGPVRSAYTTYNADGWRGETARQPEWTDMEYQLRNWQYYTWLSGDHISEQAIHSLDRLLWAFGDEMPTAVLCTGGRELRTDRPLGNNVFDHFLAAFEFADGRRGFHMCRHYPGCARDNTDYVTGTTGTATINGRTVNRLETADGTWDSDAPKNDMYQQEHDELFASIRAEKPIDDGEILVNANALAIMARMSAYTGQPVTLEKLWASQENLAPERLALDAPPPPTPIAVPGRTPLV